MFKKVGLGIFVYILDGKIHTYQVFANTTEEKPGSNKITKIQPNKCISKPNPKEKNIKRSVPLLIFDLWACPAATLLFFAICKILKSLKSLIILYNLEAREIRAIVLKFYCPSARRSNGTQLIISIKNQPFK